MAATSSSSMVPSSSNDVSFTTFNTNRPVKPVGGIRYFVGSDYDPNSDDPEKRYIHKIGARAIAASHIADTYKQAIGFDPASKDFQMDIDEDEISPENGGEPITFSIDELTNRVLGELLRFYNWHYQEAIDEKGKEIKDEKIRFHFREDFTVKEMEKLLIGGAILEDRYKFYLSQLKSTYRHNADE